MFHIYPVYYFIDKQIIIIMHYVSPLGLFCYTMVPVPKDKRGSKSDSNNYRAIAISSILRKLFDSIIIKEQHSSLITDDLQFGD